MLEVHHKRTFAAGPVGTTAIRLTLETRGRDHVEEVIERLDGEGFAVHEESREA